MARVESDRHVLLVEGSDDEHVVHHIANRTNDTLEISILPKGGIDPLLNAIERDLRVPGRAAIGILADANDDLDARWQAVTDRIRRAERDIEPPTHPDPDGTIIPGGPRRPRVGIWLMPNNQSPGELEDFVAAMIPSGDSVWPRAKAYIDCIPEADRKFADGKVQRAKVHAWLAARKEPQWMGEAIRDGDLTTEAPPCQAFAAWLRQLFAP